MTLILKILWICVIPWLLLIKDVCHAIDLQRYPDGVTTIEANDKCGTSGLESDPSVLTKISKLYGHEFWTGFGIYTQLTPWIEMLGCFHLSMQPSNVYTVSSPGLCQRKCSTRYFGYNKETITCSCLNSNEIQLANGANLSSCVTKNDKAVLVYEKDGMQSTSKALWGLPQNQTSEYCRNKDKLLLHSNACQHFSQDLTARVWTNVFREEIEVERKLGERTTIPEFCLSATISDKREHVVEKRRQNCSSKLEWFVCKNVSITVENTSHKDVATDSKYGAVIGGVLGAFSMITVLGVLIVCKVRSKGIFTESNIHDYEDTSRVNFSATTYEDLDNTKHKSATATSNRTCDIDESIAPVYDEVNETSKQGNIESE